tara:strand:- start:256 stop:762 length:507 start_codon:yes stop_codon:yes gene_type:complete
MTDDWEIYKKSVNPLKGGNKKNLVKKKITSPKPTQLNSDDNKILENLEIQIKDGSGNLEKNILRKILKGKLKINDRLDLHGYTIAESKKLVLNFVNKNYRFQKRLLLIISGKGERLSVADGWKGIGKLKANIPLWLNSLALSDKIIWFDHAPPEKGGKGAFLVYLKKL